MTVISGKKWKTNLHSLCTIFLASILRLWCSARNKGANVTHISRLNLIICLLVISFFLSCSLYCPLVLLISVAQVKWGKKIMRELNFDSVQIFCFSIFFYFTITFFVGCVLIIQIHNFWNLIFFRLFTFGIP